MRVPLGGGTRDKPLGAPISEGSMGKHGQNLSATVQEGEEPWWRRQIRLFGIEASVLVFIGGIIGILICYLWLSKQPFWLEPLIGNAVSATVQAWPTATPVPTSTPCPTPTPCPTCAPCTTCTPVPTPSPTPTPSVESTNWRIRTRHNTFVTVVDDPFFVGRGVLKSTTAAQTACAVTLLKLSNSKVAFQTCDGKYKYIMAMGKDDQWILTETDTLNECAQFTMETLSSGEVSFQTCYSRYVTALNDAQDPKWVWMLKGQACDVGDWERFTLVP